MSRVFSYSYTNGTNVLITEYNNVKQRIKLVNFGTQPPYLAVSYVIAPYIWG